MKVELLFPKIGVPKLYLIRIILTTPSGGPCGKSIKFKNRCTRLNLKLLPA